MFGWLQNVFGYSEFLKYQNPANFYNTNNNRKFNFKNSLKVTLKHPKNNSLKRKNSHSITLRRENSFSKHQNRFDWNIVRNTNVQQQAFIDSQFKSALHLCVCWNRWLNLLLLLVLIRRLLMVMVGCGFVVLKIDQ